MRKKEGYETKARIISLQLDRKKDVVKIRGDKYVSLAKVEMAINKIPLVDNSCVCASSEQEHTVALICPNAQDMQVGILQFFFDTIFPK